MANAPRGFWAALVAGWVVLGAGGLIFARWKDIPAWAAWPAIAAFLIEYSFYLVPGTPWLRERFRGRLLPVYLLISAVSPYLIASLGAIEFHWLGLLELAALALVIGLWYIVLPPNIVVDIAFLALLPAVLLSGFFNGIYRPTHPVLKDIIVLGHLALIHMSVIAMLVVRRAGDTRYGFIPNSKEWRVGALYFLYFVPIGFPLALLLNAVRIVSPAKPLTIVAQFLGFLWVVGLSEEFFFRGVLQPWLEAWTWSRTVALVATSALYGLVHFQRGWKWILIAAALGCFCGLARNRTGSIRASMVTHALAAATWRAFLR
jgi:membrane protease YdiL (CAAX protease family)